MAYVQKINDHYKITVTVGQTVIQPPKGSREKPIVKKERRYIDYKPRAKSVKAQEREVQKFAAQFEEQARSGQFIDGRFMTFNDLMREWDVHWAQRPQGLTPRVRESYLAQLNRFVVPQIGNMIAANVSTIDIDKIIESMQAKDYAVKSIKLTFTAVNSVFAFAYRKSIIQENPCRRATVPKASKSSDLTTFSQDQARRFLQHLRDGYEVFSDPIKRKKVNGEKPEVNVSGYSYHQSYSTECVAFLSILILEGFRKGELVALRWRDVDFKNKKINIHQAASRANGEQFVKSPKTESSNRLVYVSSATIRLLKKLKAEQRTKAFKLGSLWNGERGRDFDENFCFTARGSANMIDLNTPRLWFTRAVGHYNEQIQRDETLTDDEKEKLLLPKIKLHSLRHAYATLQLAAGTDIAVISRHLGHANISTTLNIYTHSTEKNDKAAAEAADRIFFGA